VAAVIEIKNVSKIFDKHIAVENLSLTVEQGEIYGFLGPNGSGKSTTLRMILGLLKPTSGEIHIMGKPLSAHRNEVMHNIGCIIEKPDFYSYLSAIENLKIFSRMHGISTSKYDYKSLLQKVGLYGREKDIVKTYSHGMKQRLGLAQALLHNPNIIILDEPNTGLDPQGIIELRETILHLNQHEGKTILLSSHILNEIEEIAKSMILIHHGKTVAQGKITELLSKENLFVNVEIDDKKSVLDQLSNSQWASKIVALEDNQMIQFNISHNEVPMLTEWLVTKQIKVYNIAKMRSLENYFLKLTQAN
jgi:ABC-type multidrug transport system ATPase subunit